MPGGNDYGIPHHPEWFQDVMNKSWPPAEVAERPSDYAAIPVTVSIVWEHDGESWVDGTATRWHGQHVFVRFSDERSRLDFGWVYGGMPGAASGPLQSFVTATILPIAARNRSARHTKWRFGPRLLEAWSAP